jgi:GNAT superfamily N-acetyltransferase
MKTPSQAALFSAVDATWPAHRMQTVGNWVVRDGRGGGQRVCAASANGEIVAGDIAAAEDMMLALGQDRLFMIQGDQLELDGLLAQRGYVIKDPVDILVCSARAIAGDFEPRLHAIFAQYPMPILAEIWAAGGINEKRLQVMRRANCDKVFVLGRVEDRAAGVAFVAAQGEICMAHAVEVLARERRKGVAERMMMAAAKWGIWQGAEVFSVLATQANSGAQKLYRKMGMETACHYHYRLKIT